MNSNTNCIICNCTINSEYIFCPNCEYEINLDYNNITLLDIENIITKRKKYMNYCLYCGNTIIDYNAEKEIMFCDIDCYMNYTK